MVAALRYTTPIDAALRRDRPTSGHSRGERNGAREATTRRMLTMATCHDMKLDEVYVCKRCGLELKVVKECEDTDADCGCHPSASPCTFSCCGDQLVRK